MFKNKDFNGKENLFLSFFLSSHKIKKISILLNKIF